MSIMSPPPWSLLISIMEYLIDWIAMPCLALPHHSNWSYPTHFKVLSLPFELMALVCSIHLWVVICFRIYSHWHPNILSQSDGTSQPSLNAFVAMMQGANNDTGINYLDLEVRTYVPGSEEELYEIGPGRAFIHKYLLLGIYMIWYLPRMLDALLMLKMLLNFFHILGIWCLLGSCTRHVRTLRK